MCLCSPRRSSCASRFSLAENRSWFLRQVLLPLCCDSPCRFVLKPQDGQMTSTISAPQHEGRTQKTFGNQHGLTAQPVPSSLLLTRLRPRPMCRPKLPTTDLKSCGVGTLRAHKSLKTHDAGCTRKASTRARSAAVPKAQAKTDAAHGRGAAPRYKRRYNGCQ